MRDYMRINCLWLLGLFVAALLSLWAQGYTMTAQVEGPSALPVQVRKEMEISVAMVQESKDKSALISIQDELSLFDGIQQCTKTTRRMGPHASNHKHPHRQEKDHPPRSAPAPAPYPHHQEKDHPPRSAPAPAPHRHHQEENHPPPSAPAPAPYPHHQEKDHLPPSAPAPAPHSHHQEKDHPPPNAPAPTPYPHHQERDHPPTSAPAPAPHPQHQERDCPLPNAPALTPLPVPAPTNPSQRKSRQKKIALQVVKICGNVLSTSPLPLPFVVYWTTGYLDSTLRFYSKLSLGCTALSSYAWLTYSILQVSYKDKEQLIGLDAIVINSISWGVLAFMLMFLVMHEGLTKRGKRCIIGLVVHVLLSMVLIQFPVLRWVKSGSDGKEIIGIIAGALQVISEIIPLFSLWKIWSVVYPLLGHRDGPAIRNYKKMTIVARAIDCFVTLYWMQFCISTYEFDAFGIANVISASLSFISFVAHSAWALKPSQ